MLGDIHSSSSVFTTKPKTLQEPKKHQDYRRRNSNRAIAGKKSNGCCRSTHDQQCYEERKLSSDEIADAPEYKSPRGPDGKPDSECRESFQEIRGRISFGVELRRDDCRETAEDVEVVPLDHRAGR